MEFPGVITRNSAVSPDMSLLAAEQHCPMSLLKQSDPPVQRDHDSLTNINNLKRFTNQLSVQFKHATPKI
jgi:hypothetical protein